MTIHKYVAITGLLAALVGFICLFPSVEVKPPRGIRVDCGSIFTPNEYAGFGADLYDAYTGGRGESGGGAACEDALSSRKVWVFILLFGGAVVALGGVLTAPRNVDRKKQVDSGGPSGTTSA